MILASGLGIAVLRSGVVAIVAVVAAAVLDHVLTGTRSRAARRGLGAALLLTWLTPALLVGYAYANWRWLPVRSVLLRELLAGALLAAKLTPVAVGVLWLSPPPAMSAEARYLRRLAPSGSRLGRRRIRDAWAFLVHGPARVKAIAGLAVFLLCFQDFELASLLGVRSWTVWLFDALASWSPIGVAMRGAALAVLGEAVVLALGLWMLMSTHRLTNEAPDPARQVRPMRRAAAWVYIGVSLCVIVGLPGALVFRGLVEAMAMVVRNRPMMGELGASVLYAVAAAGVAAYVSAWLLRQPGRRRALLLALCVPGLFGGLVLALGALWVFTRPGLSALYDTPVPIVLTLVLLALPIAVLLRLLLDAHERDERLHLADLLRGSPVGAVRRSAASLRYTLRGRPRVMLVVLLFALAYFELSASAILAPVAMTPMIVRLYNMMHYGQSAALSALVALFVAVPVVAAVLALEARPLWARSFRRG